MEWSYFDTVQHAKKIYSRVLEPVCKRWNLNRSDLDVLLYLANNPGCDRAADIVTNRGIAKSQVSMSLVNLQQRGFVLRREDAADRRTVRIRLTEASEEPIREGRDAQNQFFREIFSGISREELDLWQKLMWKVQENIAGMDE